MRLPRMTIRRWIVTVVVLASVMGALTEVNRELRQAYRYRDIASWYAMAEKMNRGGTVTFPGGITFSGGSGEKLAGYYEELKRKYERAAARPWLPIQPDAPLPEP
jgi:hypothetical protein